MKQFFGKGTLIAVCAAAALFFTTQPAQAQEVNEGGSGDHLIFGYWTTDRDMTTLLSVHSPAGVKNSGEAANVVSVSIRDMMNKSMAEFNICLMPGDSWTASISPAGEANSMLKVQDPGKCDADVNQDSATRVKNPIPTPMKGEMVDVAAMGGLIYAYTNPVGSLKDDTIPCKVSVVDVSDRECTEGVGFDVDTNPDDAKNEMITGTAYLVDPMGGFSSSYNATALTDCSGYKKDGALKGCTSMEITKALKSGKYQLLGRWTALSDMNVSTRTDVVLTLPMNHLNYEKGFSSVDDDDDIPNVVEAGTDPVSLYAFDDMGRAAFVSHEVMLDKAVNMCTFDGAPKPMVMCNGMSLGEFDSAASGGEFRIFNNTVDCVEEKGAYPIKVGDQEICEAFNLGTENDKDFDESAQVTAEEIVAIGLVLTFFEGTDGKNYDQAVSLQWGGEFLCIGSDNKPKDCN